MVWGTFINICNFHSDHPEISSFLLPPSPSPSPFRQPQWRRLKRGPKKNSKEVKYQKGMCIKYENPQLFSFFFFGTLTFIKYILQGHSSVRQVKVLEVDSMYYLHVLSLTPSPLPHPPSPFLVFLLQILLSQSV